MDHRPLNWHAPNWLNVSATVANFAHCIAIVDDEAPVRRALERLLRSAGLVPRGFASGGEFLASLATRHPDCVVADLHMPGMSGLDLVRCLRLMDLRLPVVVITAYDEPSSRARCIAAGAVAYQLKPLDERVLLDAIALAIGPRSNSACRPDLI